VKRRMSPRLLLADTIVTFLLKEGGLVAVAFWGLPEFGISLPWWLVAIIGVALAVQSYFSHVATLRLIRKKPVTGIETMVGRRCQAVTELDPEGYVKLDGELWIGVSTGCAIERGVEAEIIAVDGLKLMVR